MLIDLIETGLWPEILTLSGASILIVSSMFTSAITAAFGLGGGVIMLALLVNFLPVAVVIPIHGVIQLGSNTSRAFLLRKDIIKPIIVYYFLGAILGAVIGGQFVVALPEGMLLGILGIFILYIVWGPKPKNLNFGNVGNVIGGVFITFATMFIGATGPLAMALLPRKELEALQVSATHGALMVIQHGLKIIIFGFLGFQFVQWALFLAFMVVGGFVGSLFGRAVLKRLPQNLFQHSITIILTILAIRMLYKASVFYF